MVNKVILQGRLVRDVELKKTASEVSYTEFTVAWSEKYKEAETKCFLRCKAWRHNAEFIEKYFKKGSEIIIEGRMETEEWEKDGEKQSRTICLVERTNFAGSKADNSTAGNSNDDFLNIPENTDEELPFA